MSRHRRAILCLEFAYAVPKHALVHKRSEENWVDSRVASSTTTWRRKTGWIVDVASPTTSGCVRSRHRQYVHKYIFIYLYIIYIHVTNVASPTSFLGLANFQPSCFSRHRLIYCVTHVHPPTSSAMGQQRRVTD